MRGNKKKVLVALGQHGYGNILGHPRETSCTRQTPTIGSVCRCTLELPISPQTKTHKNKKLRD